MDSYEFDGVKCENSAEIKPDSFAAVMPRIQLITGAYTQADLGKYLGVRQSSISDGKRRNKVPCRWLLTLLYKKWINPIWLLTGKGEMFVAPVAVPPSCPAFEEETGSKSHIDAYTTDELVAEVLRRSLLRTGDMSLKEDVLTKE